MIVIKDLAVEKLGEPLFENVNLVIRPGERLAILGSNSTTVTTFLRVLAEEVEMDAGTVTTEGEQVTYVSSEVVNAGPDAFVQILHARPTFLLLDVNGTTPEALKKITGLIAGFRGGMLIASEDTGVMQVAKVTRVIEIQDATKAITSYTGSFAEYLVEREKNRIRVSEAYEKQQKEKRRIEDWLTKKQIEASNDRSPQKGATIRTKKKYLQREILDKEIPNPGLIIPSETVD